MFGIWGSDDKASEKSFAMSDAIAKSLSRKLQSWHNLGIVSSLPTSSSTTANTMANPKSTHQHTSVTPPSTITPFPAGWGMGMTSLHNKRKRLEEEEDDEMVVKGTNATVNLVTPISPSSVDGGHSPSFKRMRCDESPASTTTTTTTTSSSSVPPASSLLSFPPSLAETSLDVKSNSSSSSSSYVPPPTVTGISPPSESEEPPPLMTSEDLSISNAEKRLGSDLKVQHAPSKPPPQSADDKEKTSSMLDMDDSQVVDQVRTVIDSQFNYEILLKHNELRLINQELAKCQVALEQLRRCHLIPYPVNTPTPEQMLAVASGQGAPLQPPPGMHMAPWAPPFGVVDGPYARHYAKWLIPDPVFDGQLSSATNLRSRTSQQLDHGRLGRTKSNATPLDPSSSSSAYSRRPGRAGSFYSKQTMMTPTSAMVPPQSARALGPLGTPTSLAASTVGSHQLGGAGVPKASSHAAARDKSGPCIVRRADGTTVKLVCLDCQRQNFSSTQGFINHCRIAHRRDFKSHEQAAVESGQPLTESELAKQTSRPVASTIPLSQTDGALNRRRKAKLAVNTAVVPTWTQQQQQQQMPQYPMIGPDGVPPSASSSSISYSAPSLGPAPSGSVSALPGSLTTMNTGVNPLNQAAKTTPQAYAALQRRIRESLAMFHAGKLEGVFTIPKWTEKGGDEKEDDKSPSKSYLSRFAESRGVSTEKVEKSVQEASVKVDLEAIRADSDHENDDDEDDVMGGHKEEEEKDDDDVTMIAASSPTILRVPTDTTAVRASPSTLSPTRKPTTMADVESEGDESDHEDIAESGGGGVPRRGLELPAPYVVASTPAVTRHRQGSSLRGRPRRQVLTQSTRNGFLLVSDEEDHVVDGDDVGMSSETSPLRSRHSRHSRRLNPGHQGHHRHRHQGEASLEVGSHAPPLISDDGEYDESDENSDSSLADHVDSDPVPDVAEIRVEDDAATEATRLMTRRAGAALMSRGKKEEDEPVTILSPLKRGGAKRRGRR